MSDFAIFYYVAIRHIAAYGGTILHCIQLRHFLYKKYDVKTASAKKINLNFLFQRIKVNCSISKKENMRWIFMRMNIPCFSSDKNPGCPLASSII